VSSSLWRDYVSGFEESDEALPVASTGESGEVGKIDGKAATKEQQIRLRRCRGSLLKSQNVDSTTIH
jgi:hypothetical protein